MEDNKKEVKKMARRYRIGKAYVVRRRDGTFKKWTRIGRSLRADKRKRAKRTVRSGYGHRGDLRRR